MTPSQLPVLAHAPCTSTMVGLGPAPTVAASAVPADAIWLSGMTKPAMATMTVAIMRRSLPGCAIRVMFTGSPFLVCLAPVRTLGCAATRSESASGTQLRVSAGLLHLPAAEHQAAGGHRGERG